MGKLWLAGGSQDRSTPCWVRLAVRHRGGVTSTRGSGVVIGNAAVARERGDGAVLGSLHPHRPRYLLPQHGVPGGTMAPRRWSHATRQCTQHFRARVSRKGALLTQRKEAWQVGPELCAPVLRVLLKISQDGIEFLQRTNMGTTGKKEKLYVMIFLIR